MDRLEIIRLNEVSQKEKDKYHKYLNVESKSMIQINTKNRKRLTDIRNKLIVTKEEAGRNKLGVWDQQIHTTIENINIRSYCLARRTIIHCNKL